MDLTLLGPPEKCGVYARAFSCSATDYACCVLRGGIALHNRGWAAAPSEAGWSALAVAFVFGPSGQDCGGIHGGKLL